MRDNRTKVKGNNNVVDQSHMNGTHIQGDKNNVNSNNRKIDIHETTVHVKAEQNAGTPNSEGLPILFGIFALTVFAAWSYVRHLDSLIGYLRIATLASAAPAVPTVALLISNLRQNFVGSSSIATTLFPPVSAIALLWMFSYVAGQMPPEIVALASTHKAWDFWNSLSGYGQQVLLQNLGAVVAVAIATCINLLMGLNTLGDQGIYANGPSVFAKLYGSTFQYRPARAGFFMVLFVVFANLLVTGKAVELFHQFQDLMKSAMS